MNWKLRRLKKQYNKHFNREMKLIEALHKANLTEQEFEELNNFILSHPHAKAALQIEPTKLEEVQDRIRDLNKN